MKCGVASLAPGHSKGKPMTVGTPDPEGEAVGATTPEETRVTDTAAVLDALADVEFAEGSARPLTTELDPRDSVLGPLVDTLGLVVSLTLSIIVVVSV